jgi:uncharacterized protein DUF1559
LAVANYDDQYKHYPAAYVADERGRPMHSWRIALLPYLEHQELHKQYDFAEPWDGPSNRALAERMPRFFAFDGDYEPGLTITNFLAVVGPETVWPGAATVKAKDVSDGASSTILIVENAGAGIPWMAPRDLSFAAMSFQRNVQDEISSKYVDPSVAMLDASVRRLHADITPATLRALLTIRGGERIQQDEGGWSVLEDGRDREVKKAR